MEKTIELYHIMLYRIHLAWEGLGLTTLVVIGIDCIGSCKFKDHAITTTMTSQYTIVIWITYIYQYIYVCIYEFMTKTVFRKHVGCTKLNIARTHHPDSKQIGLYSYSSKLLLCRESTNINFIFFELCRTKYIPHSRQAWWLLQHWITTH